MACCRGCLSIVRIDSNYILQSTCFLRHMADRHGRLSTARKQLCIILRKRSAAPEIPGIFSRQCQDGRPSLVSTAGNTGGCLLRCSPACPDTGVSQSLLHHKGGIVYQIIGGYDIQLIIIFFQPARKFIADRSLSGGYKRQLPDILRPDEIVGGPEGSPWALIAPRYRWQEGGYNHTFSYLPVR